jgi:xylan 1,4-beta-xylosidase
MTVSGPRTITRRRFFRNASATSLALSLTPGWRMLAETPRSFYTNPIMGGDHPDASPIRVGNEFYLTHSSFGYAPGLLIWHSFDLVNWQPVAAALHRYYGSVWAPYLCEYQGHFYIYFPANNRIFVVHASHPTGPWSEPIDLGISAIDPAHIAENGRRFLYTNGGQMFELTPDGLAVKSPARQVFEPWPVPSSTRMECTCLEAPKLLEHNGYFYLNVAEGGTGGPATSHSVISARSRHADGPWEFSPYNPIVHTQSRDDRWLSLGHGRLVDTPDGNWYMTAHSYENGYRTLGRQLLLLPIAWTADGWFRVQPEIAADSAIPMPVPGRSQEPFLDPSDKFVTTELGLQWGFWQQYDPARFETGKGFLRLAAQGKGLADTSVLTAPVGGHAYTIEVDVAIDPGCEGGLLLFYDPEHATGITLGPQGLNIRIGNGAVFNHPAVKATRAMLRIVNDRQEIDFYFRLPDQPWRRGEESAEISGMHHNILGGFLDVRPALSSWGTGNATFRNFRFWPGVNLPT